MITTPGTYTLWLRGHAPNAAGDSLHAALGNESVSVTGFEPRAWAWTNKQTPTGGAARLAVKTPGLYTINLRMREDGLRIDRLLLTTDTTYTPTDFGPPETTRQPEETAGLPTTVNRTIDYTPLYHFVDKKLFLK